VYCITEKVDLITHIPQSHLGEQIPPPRSVKIELTGLCNFSCNYCARNMKLREMDDMDRTFYERVVKEMQELGVEELGLFYLGESFMVPWLPEAVQYAKDVGFPYVFLTTNGSLATEDKVRSCMKAGLDSIKWSYNYSDGNQLKEIAKVKTSYFDLIKKNVIDAHKVREEGYDCGLYASYIKYDGEQGKKMEQAIEEIRPYVDEVYCLPLYNQAGFVTEREKALGMEPSPGNRGRLENPVSGIPCWALFTEGHISWDGKLVGCCFSHTPDFDFGDLNEQDFMTAWNSEKAQNLRKVHLTNEIKGSPCEQCFK